MISLTKCICSINTNVSRRYSKYVKIKKDPGISKRTTIINPNELQELEDMELDDLETDFMDVHKSYKQHVKETEAMSEQLKYLIVKQKYFKEKYPNFLSWHDKEQMRFLHDKDPEEWTIEKLSDSFPALPEIVEKILKAKFVKSDSKIKNHDSVVEKNWREFRQGKLENVPPDLAEHLHKFTARTLNTQDVVKRQEIVNRPKIQSEFSEIITSYEKLKNKTNKNIELNLKFTSKNTDKDTYLLIDKHKMKDKTVTTLTELQKHIENKAVKGRNLSQEEQIIYKDVAVTQSESEENFIALNQEDVTAISENKYNTSTGLLEKKTEKDYSHLIYPEKIIIPKELKKRGYTYRLNDCYYDYDGEFLYRVPGMG